MPGSELVSGTHIERDFTIAQHALQFSRFDRAQRGQFRQGCRTRAVHLGILEEILRPRWKIARQLRDELFPAPDLQRVVGQPFRADRRGALGAHVLAAERTRPVRGIDQHIVGQGEQLRMQAEEATSDYDKEKLQERLAKLVGGVAAIKVGAATEMELKEKKARVEDAMHATRAAVEEGIVPGGGTAYLRCIPVLEKLKLHDDEATGVNIVRRALEEPIRQIAQNAGHEGALIVGRVRESKDENFGFNAETGEFEDMIKAGVIDPAKVTRLALQNAASVVSLMLTTEVLIADIKDEEQLAAASAGGGMGGAY